MDSEREPGPGEASQWSFPLPGGAVWIAWHAWVDGESTWVDAMLLEEATGRRVALDVGSVGDDDGCVSGTQALAAFVEWGTGSVLRVQEEDGVAALIVGEQALSGAVIEEALLRAHREGLLPDVRDYVPFGLSD